MTFLVVSNIALFLPVLVRPFDAVGAIYLALAVVSIIYHWGQNSHDWCDVQNDHGLARRVDHMLGYVVFAINIWLVLHYKKTAVVAVTVACAALSGWFYFQTEYPMSHSLWHITVGVGSALARLC